MQRLRWQLLVVVLALGAIAFLLLGQQPNLIPISNEADATAEPITGGIYSEALIGSPGRLNPLLDYYNSVDHDIDNLIFSSLIRYDGRGLPQGDLAEAWGISQDGTSYSFSIREDANWQDGEPVIADDILFTIEMMREEAIPIPEDIRQFWDQVDIQILDDKTIQFNLPEAFAPFMDYLTFGVLPVHLLSEVKPEAFVDADFNLQPVGSGPFKFEGMLVKDGQITGVHLSAFEDYYGSRPFIDEIFFQYYPDAASALEAYRAGDVMGISQITPDILNQALSEDNLRVYTSRLPGLSMVFLNLDNDKLPFFQDAKIRRALLMGLNRQWIIDSVLGGQAMLANGPILPGTWAYFDDIEKIPYDPEKALDAIKDAGYTIPSSGGSVRAKDDVYLRFQMVYPDEGAYAQIAAAIQRDWKRLGIDVTLKAVPYQELLNDSLATRQYEAALIDLNFSRSPDPDPYPFWHQTQISAGQNYSGWNDRQASEYLEQARVIDDLAERIKRYRNFQVRFTSEMPALPLFHPVYSYGVDAEVQGISMGPLFDPSGRFNTIVSWFMREGVASAQVEAGGVEGPAPTVTP